MCDCSTALSLEMISDYLVSAPTTFSTSWVPMSALPLFLFMSHFLLALLLLPVHLYLLPLFHPEIAHHFYGYPEGFHCFRLHMVNEPVPVGTSSTAGDKSSCTLLGYCLSLNSAFSGNPLKSLSPTRRTPCHLTAARFSAGSFSCVYVRPFA